MNKLKVVVCGTGFGRFYIRGIREFTDRYRLVGIISRGSSQSKRLAEKLQITLFDDYTKVTKQDADVVCVVVRTGVVGGEGTEIAKHFLEKGIHVVIEQPIHYEDILGCYRIANKNNCTFHVESFYPYLQTTRAFISTANRLLEKAEPVYLETACSLQVLYPMLDVVGLVMGGFKPVKIDRKKTVQHGLFTDLYGEIKGVSWNLRIQNEMDTTNPDNNFHLFHKIRLYTVAGCLEMTESHGDIVWTPRYIIPKDEDGILTPYLDETLLKLKLTEQAGIEPVNIETMFEELWPKTIAYFMDRIYEVMTGSVNNSRIIQHNIETGKLWNEVGSCIGPSNSVETPVIRPLKLKDINGGDEML